MLSRESDSIFQDRALASPGAILVSFWHRPGMPADSGTPTGWLSALPQPLVHLHCVCPPEIAAQRFLRRERHQGHLDTEKSFEDVIDSLRAIDRLPPIPIEPRIEVSTDREVQFEPLLCALLVSPGPPEPGIR